KHRVFRQMESSRRDAGRHIAQRVYHVIEFAVERISCARVQIDAIVGLDGNRSVAVDFYFPGPIGGFRQLCYGESVIGEASNLAETIQKTAEPPVTVFQ